MAHFAMRPAEVSWVGIDFRRLAAELHEASACLAHSGDHGNRQGALVAESVAGFGRDLVSALRSSVDELGDFGAVTAALASIVEQSDSGTAARIAAAQAQVEPQLTMSGFLRVR